MSEWKENGNGAEFQARAVKKLQEISGQPWKPHFLTNTYQMMAPLTDEAMTPEAKQQACDALIKAFTTAGLSEAAAKFSLTKDHFSLSVQPEDMERWLNGGVPKTATNASGGALYGGKGGLHPLTGGRFVEQFKPNSTHVERAKQIQLGEEECSFRK